MACDSISRNRNWPVRHLRALVVHSHGANLPPTKTYESCFWQSRASRERQPPIQSTSQHQTRHQRQKAWSSRWRPIDHCSHTLRLIGRRINDQTGWIVAMCMCGLSGCPLRLVPESVRILIAFAMWNFRLQQARVTSLTFHQYWFQLEQHKTLQPKTFFTRSLLMLLWHQCLCDAPQQHFNVISNGNNELHCIVSYK